MRLLTLLLTLCLAGMLPGCSETQNSSESTASDTDAESEPNRHPLSPGQHRFCFVTNDDTAILEITVTDRGITGTFMNHYFGKDRNDGPLENARFSGDTLYADYKFWSEGVWSLRDIAFLIRNGQAHEGFGPSEMSGEKVVFTDPGNLSFQGPLLSKATCGGNVDKIQ